MGLDPCRCMLPALTPWQICLQTNFLSPTKKKFIFSKIIRIFSHGNIQIMLKCLHTFLVEKKLKKRYQEKWENAYLTLKNAKSRKKCLGPRPNPGSAPEHCNQSLSIYSDGTPDKKKVVPCFPCLKEWLEPAPPPSLPPPPPQVILFVQCPLKKARNWS